MQNVLRTRQTGEDFFARFEEAADNNLKAAHLLDDLCKNFVNVNERVQQIDELEHRGDEISHTVYEQLNQVFMPPLDREDIFAITRSLDDVMDFIHSSADAMYVYNVSSPTDTAKALALVIVTCTEELSKNISKLRSRRTMRELQATVIELNRLENEADELLRGGLIELFHQPHDPKEILAWSKIYEMMEEVTDKTEDIADVLRGLMIKHA